ncbi:MAG: NAD(P)/FAD-dependent oxidoreductase [Acidobacteriota bacterium]
MSTADSKTAVIIGGGPAGLTVAYELQERTDIQPVVLEKSDYLGGIARTVRYKGNRIDIGGHRFFSKSDRVMDWWFQIMPMESVPGKTAEITYHKKTRTVEAGDDPIDPETEDVVMLVRSRRSRIYYLRKFFDYPISLSLQTLANLGLIRTIKIGFSYLRSMAFPIRKESNLEHFLINRFGRELYLTFFKSYTEKVWGTRCENISAEWGAQRIKGLSILSALRHFFTSLWRNVFGGSKDVSQKDTETSLIERFLYPKYGPGQMWEEVAKRITDKGAELHMETNVVGLKMRDDKSLRAVVVEDAESGERREIEGDIFFSTMPIQELMRSMDPAPPAAMREISDGLVYRDFFTVGLLVDRLKIRDKGSKLISDNWIYIQEPEVQVGRLQIFNNWSPYLVADPSKVWIGLEYFCNEGDDLWSMDDEALKELGRKEMELIDIIEAGVVQDAVVIRMPKTYPAYFGTYDRFPELRSYIDGIENLYLLGRNGMHRYNNQDHSMLTAMVAVDNIIEGRTDKANIWDINTEEEYHEEKSS